MKLRVVADFCFDSIAHVLVVCTRLTMLFWRLGFREITSLYLQDFIDIAAYKLHWALICSLISFLRGKRSTFLRSTCSLYSPLHFRKNFTDFR
jgi:hypothetical protein